jgi:hypothetical protein
VIPCNHMELPVVCPTYPLAAPGVVAHAFPRRGILVGGLSAIIRAPQVPARGGDYAPGLMPHGTICFKTEFL